MPFPLTDREFVVLDYHEILPEDNFALVARMSIDRPDVPPDPKFVRAEAVMGMILRGSPHGGCTFTHIYHVDMKVHSSNSTQFNRMIQGNTDVMGNTWLKSEVVKSSTKQAKRIRDLISSQTIRRFSADRTSQVLVKTQSSS